MNRRQALQAILVALQAVIDLEPAEGEAAQGPRALTRADFAPPSLSIDDVTIPTDAKAALVPVRISGPTPHTIYATAATRNGSGANYAYAGGQFTNVTPYLSFRPGDSLVQEVSVPTKGAADGQHFELIFPEQVEPYDTKITKTIGAIGFKAGAPAQTPATVRRRPAHVARKGSPTFEFDLKTFQATDSGYADAAMTRPCWRTRHEHGRDQAGNGEPAFYTDPVLYPGTRPFEVRDDLLILRAEKLRQPLGDASTGGRTYANAAAVLTTSTLLNQTFGYFEWEARLPDWWWPGLWLYGKTGSDEIDVMERWPGYSRFTSNAGLHHPLTDCGARLRTDRIFDAGLNLVDEFHRHAVEWREDFITWYIDDNEVYQSVNPCTRPLFALMDVTLPQGTPDWAAHGDPRSCEMAIRSFRVWA